jgi:hypothetical protein
MDHDLGFTIGGVMGSIRYLPFGNLLENKIKIEYQHCVGSPNVAQQGLQRLF